MKKFITSATVLKKETPFPIAVRKMRERLYKLGYITKGSCTGYYGEATQKYLKIFQRNAGLPQTGIVDSETLAVLYADDAPKNSQ